MRLLVLIFFGFCSATTISCQTFDFYVGPNFNIAHTAFCSSQVDTVRVYPGVSLAMQKAFKIKNRSLEFAVSYAYYRGQFSHGYNSFANAYHTYGYYQNHAISLELYPLMLGDKNFKFTAGLVASYRFLSSNNLFVSNWHDISSGTFSNIYDSYEWGNEWGRNVIAGFQLNFTQYFKFGPSTSIVLRGQIYQGLTGDYIVYNRRIGRTALSPQIGIRKTF